MPKLVGLQELCASPEGTIFADSDQYGNVDGLYRLVDVLHIPSYGSKEEREKHVLYYGGEFSDLRYQDLQPDADEDGTFPDVADVSRWGMFDPGAKFVVYSKDDVLALTEALK